MKVIYKNVKLYFVTYVLLLEYFNKQLKNKNQQLNTYEIFFFFLPCPAWQVGTRCWFGIQLKGFLLEVKLRILKGILYLPFCQICAKYSWV